MKDMIGDICYNYMNIYVIVFILIITKDTLAGESSNLLADFIIQNKEVRNEKCALNTDCQSCVSAYCGWCESTRKCMEGDPFGPSPGNYCANATTAWRYGYCSEHCASHISCSDCLDDLPCGWCGENGTCAVGTIVGPYYINCTANHWIWYRNECNGAVTISIWVLIGLFTTFFVLIIGAWITFLIYKWRLHIIQRNSEPKAAFS